MGDNFRFTSFPRPLDVECLSGYIQRVAVENEVNPIEILKYCLCREVRHFTKFFGYNMLDFLPEVYINTNRLAKLCSISENDVNRMTIKSIKSFTTEDLPPRSGSMQFSNIFLSDRRKYCPLCLQETRYYKLIWQIKDITVCLKHKVKLIDTCPNCNSIIPILSRNVQVGFCSNCKSSLFTATPDHIFLQYKDLYLNMNYKALMGPDEKYLLQNNIEPEVYLCILILYVLDFNVENKMCINHGNKNLDSKDFVDILKTLFGIKRTKILYLNIKCMINILCEKKITLKDIPNIVIPEDYINNFANYFQMLERKLPCIAQFCKSYNKPGSLEYRQYSRIYEYKDNFYVDIICRDCNIRYRYSITNGNMETVNRHTTEELNNLLLEIKKNTPLDKIEWNNTSLGRYISYFRKIGVLE